MADTRSRTMNTKTSRATSADMKRWTETFALHFCAQIEARPGDGDDERARAITIAKARTEQMHGVVLSPRDVMRMIDAAKVVGAKTRVAYGTDVVASDFEACIATLRERGLDGVCTLARMHDGLSVLRSVISPGGPVRAQLDAMVAVHVSEAAKERMFAALSAEPFEPHTVLAQLQDELSAHDVFREWMGTMEGTSLKTHTLQVGERYLIERPHYDVNVPDGVRFEPMMRFMLTLHDVGKPTAVEAGDRERQHAITTPVLVALATKFGFSTQEIAIMRALVDNDAIGEMLQPRRHRSVDDAAGELRQLAREVGMCPKDYFILQSLFFVADAGSYRFLVERYFTQRDSRGALQPTAPAFEELRAAMAS